MKAKTPATGCAIIDNPRPSDGPFPAALIHKDEKTGENGYVAYQREAETNLRLQTLDDLCERIVDSVDPRGNDFNLTTGFGPKRAVEIEVRFYDIGFTIMPEDFVRVAGSTALTRSSIVKTVFDAIRQVVDHAERKAIGPAHRKPRKASAARNPRRRVKAAA